MAYETNQNSRETYAKSVLEDYAKNWKIFMDTCSILHFAADKFWLNIIPLLRQYQNKIIIPLRSIEELQKHESNTRDSELAKNAKNCLRLMKKLINAGFVEIRGEQGDNFADNVFQVVFTKFRMTYKLLLITQDNDLAKDIIALNSNKSVRANPVQVKRINQYGFFSNFKWNAENANNDYFKKPQRGSNENDLDEGEVFRICKRVTTLEDTRLAVSHIPVENEIVYTSRGPIKLGAEIAAGGEGIIYTTNTPYVAKIYKKENNTKRKYEKIKLVDCIMKLHT